ncbi:hypothetical protein D4R71_00145, partial [bacterium]
MKKLNLKYVLAAMLIAVFVLPQICMADITYGSEYSFNNAGTYESSATALDATHTLIAYRDNGNTNYGTAVIAIISGGNIITYGTEYVFNNVATYDLSATALDATHALIAYKDCGNNYYGTGIIATLSGGNI